MTVVEAAARGDSEAEYVIDISPESLAKTTMGGWQVGTKVNLETSLKIGDENGGHNVMGHVDGLAELISIVPRGESFDLGSGSTPIHGLPASQRQCCPGWHVLDHC